MTSPLAPTGLSPYGGQAVAATIENIFSWQSDGTQAAFYLEYARNITGATVSNTGWITDSLSQYAFVANTFTNTYEYKWRVKIRNSVGQESLFSDWAVFRAGNAVPLIISFPANEYDQVLTLPTYQHVFAPPDGAVQYSYRYQVYIGATWDDWDAMTATQQDTLTSDEVELYNATLIWDSGEVVSTATSVEQPAGHFITGEYWYKVRVTIRDSNGKSYISDLRSFYILLDSVPKAPIVSAIADPVNGRNVITITNPTPDAGQVSVAYNRLYRKNQDGCWELIQDNISGLAASAYSVTIQPPSLIGTYEVGYDTTCRSSKQEEYVASAVGTNGIESGKSPTSAFATCQLTDYWFTNLSSLTTIKLRLDARWGQMQSEREREEQVGMDEQFPSVNYGSRRFYRGSFQASVEKPDGMRWTDFIAQIRTVLDNGDRILYRSMFGDVYEVDIYDFTFNPADHKDQYREISFSLVEIAEAEPSGTHVFDSPPNPLTGFWLIDPDTNTGMEVRLGTEWGGMVSEQNRFEGIGLNSLMPSVNRGSKKAYRSGFSGYLIASDAESTGERVKKFRELVDGKSKKPLVLKSINGDLHYVDTYGFSFELYDRFNNARKVSFEFIEIGGL